MQTKVSGNTSQHVSSWYSSAERLSALLSIFFCGCRMSTTCRSFPISIPKCYQELLQMSWVGSPVRPPWLVYCNKCLSPFQRDRAGQAWATPGLTRRSQDGLPRDVLQKDGKIRKHLWFGCVFLPDVCSLPRTLGPNGLHVSPVGCAAASLAQITYGCGWKRGMRICQNLQKRTNWGDVAKMFRNL